jgi:MFS family permease
MYGVSEGPFKGWGTPLIVGTIVSGAVLVFATVVVELRTAHPMIDVRLFRDRLFRSSCAVLGIGSASFLGLLFLVALFFQDGLGLSALQSGLSTFPEAIGIMIGAQVVTRLLYPVFGPRRIMVAGLLVMATTLSLMTLVDENTNLWWMRLLLFVAGYGMSHVFVPSQAAGFATISQADTGRGSTLFNALRQLGGAAGVALLTSVVAAVGPVKEVGRHVVPNLSAYHAAFLVAAGVAVLAAVAALTVNDADAAKTMVRRPRRSRAAAAAAGDAVEPAPAAV